MPLALLREDEVADLQRQLRGIIRRLDELERGAFTASASLIRNTRGQVQDVIPDRITPGDFPAFSGNVSSLMTTLQTNFGDLVESFAFEGVSLGEDFAEQQLRSVGIDPASLGAVGLTGAQFRSIAGASAAEAEAAIQAAASRLNAELARVFLAPEPNLTKIRTVIKDNLSTRRSGGSLSGAIAKVSANLRTSLGRMFSEASEAIQKAAAERDPSLRKMWVTKGDAKVREDHVIAGRNHGRRGKPGPIKVTERFQVGRVRLRFPRDPDARGGRRQVQAQVIRCR